MKKEIEKKMITFGVRHFAPTMGMVIVVSGWNFWSQVT